MVSEAQQKLAHKVAAAGIWPYLNVISEMENKSGFVEQLKWVLDDVSSPSIGEGRITNAYLFARLCEEQKVATFGKAFVYFLRQRPSLPAIKKGYDAMKATLKEKGFENIPADKKEAWLDDRPVYEEKRRKACMKDDPFLAEWQQQQEESKVVVAFLKQNETTDFEAFKATYH